MEDIFGKKYKLGGAHIMSIYGIDKNLEIQIY